jgi:hypothetical protein
MSYSNFTIPRLKKEFGLQIDEQSNLFATVAAIAGSDLLTTTLQETVQLAIAINTEKARLQKWSRRNYLTSERDSRLIRFMEPSQREKFGNF